MEHAPAFRLLDEEGRAVRLRDFRGRTLVLSFYAEDGTPGCVAQLQALRDVAVEHPGVAFAGVSADPPERHRRFRDALSFPFPLLSDPGREAAKAYGAWGRKKLYGRDVVGTIRSAVVVGPDGRLVASIRGRGARVVRELRKTLMGARHPPEEPGAMRRRGSRRPARDGAPSGADRRPRGP